MTNSFVREHIEVFEMTQALRTQMMEILTDADLAFTPGGSNVSLGALCREMGEIEYTYIQSFRAFKHDWSYRNPEPGLDTSVEKLKTWFKALDEEIVNTIKGLSEEDLKKPIDRGGFQPTAGVQGHIYREAMLIFCGRASVYLKALGKTLPDQWRYWIG